MCNFMRWRAFVHGFLGTAAAERSVRLLDKAKFNSPWMPALEADKRRLYVLSERCG